ncbi:hypothetical protein ACFLSW_00725 [Candidatus Bipolaricaulota bacterium]
MSQYSQDYAMKELEAAVESLEGEGNPRERLHNASVYHLLHVKPEDLPENIREPLSAIQRALFTGSAEGCDGIAEASIAAMTDLQVSRMIENILQIGTRFSILDEAATLVEMARERVKLVRKPESSSQVPLAIADDVLETYRKALREYQAVVDAQNGRGST